ncbi:MAG: excinuclease ABC subunit C [Paludibacteraceae bacterium]|nr:excinuclease ABC subunit C [Paludibacteraceae bacterium]
MKQKDEHITLLLKRIPENPGVYQYFNTDGQIIYVGKAKNLHRRVNSYFQKDQQTYKTKQLVKHIADIKYIVVDSEQDAFLLENNLIKQHQPHYNILLKDGKSYPSICITKEDYPRIFKTRTIDKKIGDFFGPFSYGNTVDLFLELIHKLYPIRTCKMPLTKDSVVKQKHKVCLKYHLGTCCGVCENKVPKEIYNEWISQAKKIIQGNAHEIEKDLQQKMLTLSEQMKYEQAATVKEKYELLERFRSKTVITNTKAGEIDVFGYTEDGEKVYISILHLNNGSIVQGQTVEYRKQLDEPKEEMLAFGMQELREQIGSKTKEVIVPFIPDVIDENLHVNIANSGDKKKLLDLANHNVEQYKQDRIKQNDKLNPDQRATRILGQLQSLLQLPTLPVFIDSFDNSNIQGSSPVAGCVVFKKAKPCKSEYKRFQIKTVSGPDDYASMREVVRRRYQDLIDNNQPLPNLIIADGGIGQMHAIREAVEDQLGLHIPIAGLKKDTHHRTQTLLYGFPPVEIDMPITSEIFRFMVQIQDEVHRFAISYHKNKRSKAQIKSQLDDIQGVGPIIKQKLLRHFGSVTKIKSATIDELAQIVGTSRASTIYEYFQANLSL